jgi:two-component system CheB/CheR fusion protein
LLLIYDLEELVLIYADEEAAAAFDLERSAKISVELIERIEDSNGKFNCAVDEAGVSVLDSRVGKRRVVCSIEQKGPRAAVRIDGGIFAEDSFLAVNRGSLLENVYDSALSLNTVNLPENRLQISEKTMSAIFDNAVDGIVIINDKGKILNFNKAAEKIFKFSIEEAVGKDVTILMPEPHKTRHQSYIERYLNTGIPHIVGIGRKVQALKATGEIFPIDLAVAEVKLEGGRIFTGFIRDLTEQIRLESERNSFFQMSLDLFCILTPRGTIRNANPRWFDLLGYTPEEIAGMELEDFIHTDDLLESPNLIKDIVSSHQIVGRTFRFRASNREFRWILWNSAFDRVNQVIYGVARDITEQKKMLEELEKSRLEAERNSDARGMFIARMSHELRTPLNSIIGFSGILQKNLAGSFSDKDLLYLDRIRRNGNTLLKLINSILEFSRTDSGFQEINLEEINLVDLIKEIIDLMQVSIEERNVSVIQKLPQQVATIKTDQVKLRQIIQNLIDNAVKFSPDGEVQIVLDIDSEDSRPRCLEIRDSGPGIAPEHLELIFEAFQQCDNSVTRRFGGAGLGLAIASSFAHILGFAIEVESEPGKGSCFKVNFVLKQGEGS